MQWQFYWPDWYKLYPYYTEDKQDYEGIPYAAFTFCFGSLQIRGYR